MFTTITIVALALLPISRAQFLGGGGGGCGCPPPPPPCGGGLSLPSLPQPCLPQLPPISLPSLPSPCLPPLPQLSIPQCPPPPPCPPPISLPSIPPPQLPSFSLPSCPPPAPSCGCGRKKREAPLPVIRSEASGDSLCNNNTIRKIILKNMTSEPATSKAAIHSEVKARLGGNFVVLCAQGSLSFIADALNYCIDGSATQTCYVFQL